MVSLRDLKKDARKKNSKNIQFECEAELKDGLDEIAHLCNNSFAEVCRMILREGVSKLKEEMSKVGKKVK